MSNYLRPKYQNNTGYLTTEGLYRGSTAARRCHRRAASDGLRKRPMTFAGWLTDPPELLLSRVYEFFAIGMLSRWFISYSCQKSRIGIKKKKAKKWSKFIEKYWRDFIWNFVLAGTQLFTSSRWRRRTCAVMDKDRFVQELSQRWEQKKKEILKCSLRLTSKQ